MVGKTILVIDDDPHMRALLEATLRSAGATVVSAANSADGLRRLYEARPDLVVLDVMMPQTDGWTTCRRIREITDTPIIFLTALGSDAAVVRGLDCGAVDYVTKPFTPEVLLARLRAALRHNDAPAAPEPSAGYADPYLTVDIGLRRAVVADRPIHLTKTEFNLLALLVAHRGQLLTFGQILAAVWGHGYEGSDEYVHTYVSRLRRKIEPAPREPIYIIGEHGVGYRFEPQT